MAVLERAGRRADGLIREVREPVSAWRPSRPAPSSAGFIPADALVLIVRASRSDAPWLFPLFARILARRRWWRAFTRGEPMGKRAIQKEFDGIINRAVAEAAKVKCSQAEYLEGLEAMQEALEETVAMVRDEIAARERM